MGFTHTGIPHASSNRLPSQGAPHTSASPISRVSYTVVSLTWGSLIQFTYWAHLRCTLTAIWRHWPVTVQTLELPLMALSSSYRKVSEPLTGHRGHLKSIYQSCRLVMETLTSHWTDSRVPLIGTDQCQVKGASAHKNDQFELQLFLTKKNGVCHGVSGCICLYVCVSVNVQ